MSNRIYLTREEILAKYPASYSTIYDPPACVEPREVIGSEVVKVGPFEQGFRQAIDEANRNAYSQDDVIEAMCAAYHEKLGCGDHARMKAALDKYLELPK